MYGILTIYNVHWILAFFIVFLTNDEQQLVYFLFLLLMYFYSLICNNYDGKSYKEMATNKIEK